MPQANTSTAQRSGVGSDVCVFCGLDQYHCKNVTGEQAVIGHCSCTGREQTTGPLQFADPNLK